MLKMYHQNPHSGDTPDYWANSWEDIGFEDALKLCSNDPLLPLFDKYINRESLILEGGCGKGHWVAYFREKGYKIVGLDFAQRTLAELNNNRPGLSLCGGNVNMLPFADGTFDVYYSGGVVEHFEDGCEEALSEARRVLKPNGTLLLSVPYYSPLRRILTPVRRDSWRRLAAPEVDSTTFANGLTYFQYAYRISEFQKMLTAAKLETIETMGYSVIWGLYDLKFLNDRARQKNLARRANQTSTDSTVQNIDDSGDGGRSAPSLLKELLIGEDVSTTFKAATTNLMRWASANMMMFVCKKTR
jgi:SAM-dependent methyltransferase